MANEKNELQGIFQDIPSLSLPHDSCFQLHTLSVTWPKKWIRISWRVSRCVCLNVFWIEYSLCGYANPWIKLNIVRWLVAQGLRSRSYFFHLSLSWPALIIPNAVTAKWIGLRESFTLLSSECFLNRIFSLCLRQSMESMGSSKSTILPNTFCSGCHSQLINILAQSLVLKIVRVMAKMAVKKRQQRHKDH